MMDHVLEQKLRTTTFGVARLVQSGSWSQSMQAGAEEGGSVGTLFTTGGCKVLGFEHILLDPTSASVKTHHGMHVCCSDGSWQASWVSTNQTTILPVDAVHDATTLKVGDGWWVYRPGIFHSRYISVSGSQAMQTDVQ
jgi:hypothetical protein